MLARTLMSAAALAIPERMHAALLLTLSKLERGELAHGPWNDGHEFTTVPNTFNMARWGCGTSHCILGWARFLDDPENYDKWHILADNNKGLNTLCYPPNPIDLEAITTDQAASALRNYLATGAPDWAGVLG